MSQHTVYLLLGSNLGDRMKQLDQATVLISGSIGIIILHSSTYETEPWGFLSDHTFLNRAVKVITNLSPHEIMAKINEIEKLSGRERKGEGYVSRTLDIDILFYDDMVMDEDLLKIPHPRIQDRRFVLVPLNEIAPQLIHPALNKTIGELLLECRDEKEVKVIPKAPPLQEEGLG